VQRAPVLALVDGEHHPAAVRDALAQLDRERGVAGVAFVGGEEKVRREVLDDPMAHYGFALEFDPEQALRRTEARAVVDLADEPVLPPAAKLRLAALALHLGLAYEMPGTVLEPPSYETVEFDGPRLAVIGTGKRTGKTAVAGHWATLLRERGSRPVIVSMGRGGPAEPQLADENTTLADLRAIAGDGRHAASDYLEDAVLAGVPTVGCRRVGGGLVGEPFASNVAEGARLAASLEPGSIIPRGLGLLHPASGGGYDRLRGRPRGGRVGSRPLTISCAANSPWSWTARPTFPAAPSTARSCRSRSRRRPPARGWPSSPRARPRWTASSRSSPPRRWPAARRSRAIWSVPRRSAATSTLVELKAAAIDTVAVHAEREGARVIFLRNRPVALDGDLDSELLELHDRA